jgi:DNA invertase Pin-like site-specific DNA recombinase
MQLEKIQQWCAVADLELVDVLRDVDRSGKDFDARGRPAFDELLARLKAGEASALVVYRMSRFGPRPLRDDPDRAPAAGPGHPVP